MTDLLIHLSALLPAPGSIPPGSMPAQIMPSGGILPGSLSLGSLVLGSAAPQNLAEGVPDVSLALWAAALTWVVRTGVILLSLGIVLCVVRMLRGPELADRVLAADVLAMQVVGLVIMLTIELRSTIFFDAVLVVAILAFASTVAFAGYIASHHTDADDQPVTENNAENLSTKGRGA